VTNIVLSNMKSNIVTFSLLSFFVLVLLYSCKKDSADVMFPDKGDCLTTNMKFSLDIKPILANSCAFAGCHSTTSKAGGYAYETYDEVILSANNGSLIGAIKHQSGYSTMPKGGSKLSNCQISKIESWISNGAPNN
jgi:hypothetical protein